MFELRFSTNNAEFDDLEEAIALTLERVARKVQEAAQTELEIPGFYKILDSNGNTIGSWSYTNG